MPLVSVKRQKGVDNKPIDPIETEVYPYGLRISFEKEEIDKLPALKGVAVGDKVVLSGEGPVTSVRKTANETNGRPAAESHSIVLQLERVQVSGDDNQEYSDGFKAAIDSKKKRL